MTRHDCPQCGWTGQIKEIPTACPKCEDEAFKDALIAYEDRPVKTIGSLADLKMQAEEGGRNDKT